MSNSVPICAGCGEERKTDSLSSPYCSKCKDAFLKPKGASMTKLYTAAEARRIDIERGGEGFIINEYSERTYYHDDNDLIWRQKGTDSVENGAAIIKPCWFPLTPAPEAEKEDGELNLESLLRRKCDEIEQLEKELAEAKEKQRKKCCVEERPKDCSKIVYFSNDKILGQGKREDGSYLLEIPDGTYAKLCIVNGLSWKYEADL